MWWCAGGRGYCSSCWRRSRWKAWSGSMPASRASTPPTISPRSIFPLLYAYLPFAFRIMAHRLVFRVPLIGWYLRRAGALEIAPESVALSRRALREAVKTLRRGMPVVVFPEGERSPTGKMLPFRRGAFYVAMKAQAEVVPVAILGTYEGLPIGSAHLRRTPLRLVVGEPIPVAGYTPKTWASWRSGRRGRSENCARLRREESSRLSGSRLRATRLPESLFWRRFAGWRMRGLSGPVRVGSTQHGHVNAAVGILRR